MTYADMNLTCGDCGAAFLITAFEQEFYRLNNFTYETKRCRECRRKRTHSRRPAVHTSIRATPVLRPVHDVPCFVCGKSTAISFEGRFGEPVYCPDCYELYVGCNTH
jgi:CxxC-x17-CxxC domain-containing protein